MDEKKQRIDLGDIELLVMDVDGVLTDGSIVINHDGTESKSFSTVDGHGIKMWQRAGLKAALLSGRFSESTKHRAEQLGIKHCLQGYQEKLPALKQLHKQLGIAAERIAYIGDDLLDLPALKYVGFGIAVANAVDEIKAEADFITKRSGGSGAVREAIEHILKSSGKWGLLMERYLE